MDFDWVENPYETKSNHNSCSTVQFLYLLTVSSVLRVCVSGLFIPKNWFVSFSPMIKHNCLFRIVYKIFQQCPDSVKSKLLRISELIIYDSVNCMIYSDTKHEQRKELTEPKKLTESMEITEFTEPKESKEFTELIVSLSTSLLNSCREFFTCGNLIYWQLGERFLTVNKDMITVF